MALTLAAAASGCASITGSRNQPLSVQTHQKGAQVVGANCTLQNDKGSWFVTTPGSVVIQKSYSDLAVTCNKDGVLPGVATFKSGSNAGVWGNIVAGGLIGYAVDASSGAGFDYPSLLSVEMSVTQPSADKASAPDAAASAPAVQNPVTKTSASLVQYDGPKIKSGVTLDAQFLDNGSGSGEALVNDGGNHLLRGTFATVNPGAQERPQPKILDRPTLNKLQILSDKPWVIGTFSDTDTVLECVYGETRPLGQKKGECRDNFGNRYHLFVTP